MAQLLYRPRVEIMKSKSLRANVFVPLTISENQSVIFRKMEELAVKLSFRPAGVFFKTNNRVNYCSLPFILEALFFACLIINLKKLSNNLFQTHFDK
jgi:hypothetical protein